MQIIGSDGQVELLDNRIVVTRKGFFAMLVHKFAGPVDIPIKGIGRIEMKEAGILSGGSFKIVFNGSEFSEIKFQKKSNEAFKKLKEQIFAKIQH